MMTGTSNSTSNSTSDKRPASAGSQPRITSVRVTRSKPRISATERWVLISKNVYSRAQRRGFLGGDPFEDVAAAIKEVDDEYATDIRGLLALTDPVELVQQFSNLLAGFGLDKHSLEKLLAMHGDSLKKLAAANSELVNGAAERTARRIALLDDVIQDATDALMVMAQTAAHVKETAFLPGQTTQRAFRNVLSGLAGLANSLGDLVENGRSSGAEESPGSQQRMEIHGGLVKAFNGKTPAELANAPIAALKGVSSATAGRLASAFGTESISDMAGSDLLRQAQEIVTRADADPAGPDSQLADGPVRKLDGMTTQQAAVLRDAFRIDTVRDFAQNRFFRLARAIVALAEVET